MRRIALLFDRSYIDAHSCFTELCLHLAGSGFLVDLYYLQNPYNTPPIFFDDHIRLFPFPVSAFQNVEFWLKNILSSDRRYCALIGTPIRGAWLACKLARIRKIPWFYLADELFDPDSSKHIVKNWIREKEKDIRANRQASASIALSAERYSVQASLNGLPENHSYFIIPNAPSGEAVKLKSNYFRDIFNITDHKPIVLFIGSIQWNLAKRLYDDSRQWNNEEFHLIFHGRTKGLIAPPEENNSFIKISRTPLPSYLLHYAVSSADIGLVLYDRDILQERNNSLTGGKIGTYLKNKLPIIAGNVDSFKKIESSGIGYYWDAESDIRDLIHKAIANKFELENNIPLYYKENLAYEMFFKKLLDFLNNVSHSK